MTERWMRSRTALAGATACALIGLLWPASAAAQMSGGWSNLGHGKPASLPALNGKVETFTSVGSTLYLGGDFTDAGGVAAADHIVTWDGSDWSAVGSGLGNAASAVYAIAVDTTNGDVYAGGSFQNAGGDTDADRIAVFHAGHWRSLAHTPLNGPVFTLAIIGRTLYVGGGFADVNGDHAADAIVGYGMDNHNWTALTDGTNQIGGTISSAIPDGLGGLFVAGSFINAANIAQADFVAQWNGSTNWSSLGANSATTDGAINNRVRGLARSGNDLYIVGDFTNAGDDAAADHVARWNGSAWTSLGASSFFGDGTLSVYAVAVDGSHVFVGGFFLNAGGNARADGIAFFNGSSWQNLGSDAAGSGGPAPGGLLALHLLAGRLYAGGQDSHIGGGSRNAFAATYRVHRPDAQIATTGAYIGDGVYNSSGQDQEKTLTVHRGKAGTFRIKLQNDAQIADAFTVDGFGDVGGFTITYFAGSTNVSAQVKAGTYAVTLAPGASKVLTMHIKVSRGISVGTGISTPVVLQARNGGLSDAVRAHVVVN
jgi:hypothetical protein